MEDAVSERWKRVHDVFDPIEPAPEHLRVARDGYNPLSETIIGRLTLPLDPQRYVLAGGLGSGKSTELRATATALRDRRTVVLVDLWRHFEATVGDVEAINRLQPAELIGLLGLAVRRVATDVGIDLGEPGKRFDAAVRGLQQVSGTSPTVDVAALASKLALVVGGVAGAALTGPGGALAGAAGASLVVDRGLKVLEAVSGAWDWKIGLPGRKQGSDQDEPVRAILDGVNGLLDFVRPRLRTLVLLVDGLDRVSEPEGFEARLVATKHHGRLRCDLVVTLALGHVQKHRTHLNWCSRAFDFTYVPVADRRDPLASDPRGVAFLLDLARRRFEHLGFAPTVADADLERLAWASGGRLRDFVRLLREVAVEAMSRRLPVADRGCVDRAIDDLRRQHEAGLDTGHLKVLRQVLDDPDRRMPEGPVALELLQRQLLLTYPNESTWVLPHTLLMLKLVKPRGSTDSG